MGFCRVIVIWMNTPGHSTPVVRARDPSIRDCRRHVVSSSEVLPFRMRLGESIPWPNSDSLSSVALLNKNVKPAPLSTNNCLEVIVPTKRMGPISSPPCLVPQHPCRKPSLAGGSQGHP